MAQDLVAESAVDYPNTFNPLLQWYQQHRRDLPWRNTHNPYAILVSEIMLQQTRVDTVIPYYHAFLQAFPDPQSLAEASLESVYERWAGLGYYRRARNLQLAAQAIVQEGRFPDTLESLRRLPGVGAYTAAAVASIAFGQPALALDGNAERVLSRFFGLEGEAGSNRLQLRIRQATEPLHPRQQAGDFTQAVMELGATLCSPLRPSCLICPLQHGCRAQALGATGRIPSPKPRRTVEKVALCALDIRHRGEVLLEKGERWPFLQGQWMPPLFPREEQKARLQEFLNLYPGEPVRVGEIRHGITFRSLSVEIWRWHTETGSLQPQRQWHPWQEGQSRLPRLSSKILGYSP